MRFGIFLLGSILLLSACNQSRETKFSRQEMLAMTARGDSISTAVQNRLLQNVATAIEDGGTEYAVSFCSTRAIPLTDSIAESYLATVERLSDRNRNPENAIATERDSLAWQRTINEKASFVELGDEGEVIYYRPILIAMPTCLKCHGGEEIDESTRIALQEKYPHDKAVGYEMGDLRGMWKIRFPVSQE